MEGLTRIWSLVYVKLLISEHHSLTVFQFHIARVCETLCWCGWQDMVIMLGCPQFGYTLLQPEQVKAKQPKVVPCGKCCRSLTEVKRHIYINGH